MAQSINLILNAQATGTVDVIVVTYSPAITSLVNNRIYAFVSSGANTSATPTLNVNGLGAKTIKKKGAQPLVAGDIPAAGGQVFYSYRSTGDYFELINPQSVQPLNSDLTTIAGLTPTDDDIIQRKAGSWVNRTLAQLWTDLKDLTVTLTNKTISLASNTLTGTKAEFNTACSDGNFVFDDSPTINTPNIVGVTDGSSAPAGSVGEHSITSVLRSAAVSLVSSTDKTVFSFTVEDGDWDISGFLGYIFGTTTTVTVLSGGVSLTTNALPASDTFGVPSSNGEVRIQALSVGVGRAMINGGTIIDGISSYKVSVTGGPVTFYLIARSTFSTGSVSAFGSITKRRIR